MSVESNIMEKTFQIQTQENLDKNGLLYKYQSGFCAKFPTNSCLVQLSDFILRGMAKGLYTGIILVYLRKVFDTLDHIILLQKMECFGFKYSVINWFQLYLSNRKFFVALENVFSDAGLINCGVPQ